MQGMEFLYLAMFVAGFAGSALIVWWMQRRASPVIAEEVELPTFVAPASDARASSVGAGTRPTPAEHLPAVVADLGAPPVAQLLFATRKSTGDRECPKCKRRFGETTVLCPFDATPLRSLHLRHKRTAPVADPGSRRPTCLSCGRRYERSARFCYHDGTPLSLDSPIEAPIVRACRSCGFESTDARSACGCGEPDLIEVDPSRSTVQMPTIPLMHCRRCDHVGDSSTTHCPNDAELLYPVMNVSMNALPATGIGPRRKVCETCGRRFSSAAQHCAYDGTKLLHLN